MLDEEHLRMGARRLTERAHPCRSARDNAISASVRLESRPCQA
jgi:hypothetical protein